jgi:mono/diheme cytochrome c family protein
MTRTSFLLGTAVAGLAVTIACSADPDGLPSSAGVAASTAAAAPAVTAETLGKGRGIYKTTCAPCHGESGRGDGPGAGAFKPAPRDHTDRAYMDTLTDQNLGDVIQMGGAIKGKPLMPSNPQIRGTDLDALVAYVRSLSRK